MEQLKAMYPVCSLIKSDGTRCGSPALTGMTFCFQHIGGKVPTPKPETRRTNTPLNFIYPSGHEAIQHNLFLVVQALSEGKIDNATALTYNRLFRSAQLNLHRWQVTKSKQNQDEVEQQMMPCAPNPEPEPAPIPASNGCPPERTGAPDTRDVRVTGLGSATGVPGERSLLAGVETGVHGTRDVRVTGLGSAERGVDEPAVAFGFGCHPERSEGPAFAQGGCLDGQSHPGQPREFKPILTRSEELDLKLAEIERPRSIRRL